MDYAVPASMGQVFFGIPMQRIGGVKNSLHGVSVC